MLLPRLLLHRPSRGCLVKKTKLQERFAQFASGQRSTLLEESVRAEKLAHLGELSAARQALEGEAVAPGTSHLGSSNGSILAPLPVPREPSPEDLNLFEPEEPLKLDFVRFSRNIRSARRGVAGPSGMNAEHLRPVLENDRDIMKLYEFACIVTRGEVPDRIEPAVRLFRITALQKPDGGVCGIVVSDLAASSGEDHGSASVKGGRGGNGTVPTHLKDQIRVRVCLILQTRTQSSPRCAIVSVGGVGGF